MNARKFFFPKPENMFKDHTYDYYKWGRTLYKILTGTSIIWILTVIFSIFVSRKAEVFDPTIYAEMFIILGIIPAFILWLIGRFVRYRLCAE